MRGKSHGFTRVAAGTWGFLLSYDGDCPSKLEVVQRCQDSCLVARDTLRVSSSRGRAVGTPLRLSWETKGPFPVATVILELLSIFKNSKVRSPVEASNSALLLRCQRGVKPPVVMRWGTRALSRVSRVDSDIPPCLEWKHGLAFESLQGNQALP